MKKTHCKYKVYLLNMQEFFVAFYCEFATFCMKFSGDGIQDVEQRFHCFRTQHGDTCLLEVGNTLKQRGCSQMTADMKNPPALVQTFHTLFHLFFQYVQIPGEGFGRQ